MAKTKKHLDEVKSYVPPQKPLNFFVAKAYNRSAKRMAKGEEDIETWGDREYTPYDFETGLNLANKNSGVQQATYLMPKKMQRKVFETAGYVPGDSYGLVERAANNYNKKHIRNLPIYKNPDADLQSSKGLIKLSDIIYADNWSNNFNIRNARHYKDEFRGYGFDNYDYDLISGDPGKYPIQILADPKSGKIYAQGWDLNDYTGTIDKRRQDYKGFKKHKLKLKERILDIIGNPVVMQSGIKELDPSGDALQDWMRDNKNMEFQDELYMEDSTKPASEYYTHPTVHFVLDRETGKTEVVTDARRSLSNGGSIYIKPSHRGRFTALKERTGHSTTWFKENGTPAQKKMATFALNAAKWKH